MDAESLAEFEALVRADERLKVLREVRRLAADMDHNPENDPYLWGYGARRIVAMLSQKLGQQRDAMGIRVKGPSKKRPVQP